MGNWTCAALSAGLAACSGCGGDDTQAVDAFEPTRNDAPPPDAKPPQMTRLSFQVNVGSLGVDLATVERLGTPQTTVTAADGSFHFDVVVGDTVIVKVTPDPARNPNTLPMIRGVTATDEADQRIRVLYLAGPDDRAVAESLNLSFDPTLAIVEADFRNASTGGYGVTLKDGANTLAPMWGISVDGNGQPVNSQTTIIGGDGSTLALGGIAPASNVMFAPTAATGVAPCVPCDANPLPLQAGVVTWFDFECGVANCK